MLPEYTDELLYQLALTYVKDTGVKRARALLAHFGSASAVFKASVKELRRVDGFNEARAKAIHAEDVLTAASETLC
jgi:DNA processing protein